MHPLTLPRAPAETLMAVKERDGLPISSVGRLASSGGRFPAAAGLFFNKGLRRHGCSLFRSPEKSFANPCEEEKQIRKPSERSQ